MALPKKSLAELTIRYELEPGLRDIYVEGQADKTFIEWFINSSKIEDIAVYEINSIDITTDIIENFGVDNNNRGRVIALAYFIENFFGEEAPQVNCIIDRDLDTILENDYLCNILLITDYSCIEMYAFNRVTFEKIFHLYVRKKAEDIEEIIEGFSVVLENLFLIRVANYKLDWNLKPVKWIRCCSFRKDKIIFNYEKFISRYLNKNGRIKDIDQFTSVFDAYRGNLHEDTRFNINGHDFIKLLRWFCGKFTKKSKLGAESHFERLIFLCLEYDQLIEEKMFHLLSSRLIK